MKYVRIYKESGPMWGELKGETVFCLAQAPYLGLVPTGESLPLRPLSAGQRSAKRTDPIL